MVFVKLFLTAIATSFVMDMIWIGWLARNLYEENIGFLLRKSNGALAPNWSGAIIVYFAIVLGIILFVVPKANGNAFAALLWGAVFGAITYSIYDFTNYATLANWPLKVTLIDICWGMVLCGVTSFVTVALVK